MLKTNSIVKPVNEAIYDSNASPMPIAVRSVMETIVSAILISSPITLRAFLSLPSLYPVLYLRFEDEENK
jgi:hypothetical protein